MNEKLSDILDTSAKIGFSGIGTALLGLVIFLLMGIIVVIICGKKKIFKRRFKVWNIFPKLYYVYIPVIFAVFGAIFGSIYGVNKSVNKSIEAQSAKLMEAIIPELPEFQEFVDKNLDSIRVAGYSTGELIDIYFAKQEQKKEDHSFFGDIANKAGKWVMEGTIDGIINYTANQLDIETSTTEGVMNTLKSIDFNKLDESASGIVSKNINKQVNKFFKSLYFSQLIYLLIFLGIPVLEITVYFAFYAKEQKILNKERLQA